MMRLERVVSALLALVATTLALGAAHGAVALPKKALADYVHERWTVDEGLPQNSVLAILQSRSGYLWLGTHEGIARYDGRNFTTFVQGNTPALVGSGVTSMAESAEGVLWMGLRDGGVVRYADGNFDFYKDALGLPNYGVIALRAAGGALWMGTQGGGVYRTPLGKLTTPAKAWLQADGLPQNTVTALHVTSDGIAWVGTTAGLAAIVGDTVNASAVPTPLAREAISALAEHAGALWVGTPSALYRVEKGGVTARFDRRNGLVSDAVTRLLSVGDTLWIGTRDGLMRFVDQRFDRTDTQAGLPNDYIRDLWADTEGSLWVGTQSGLGRLRDGLVTMIGARQGIGDAFARTVFEDRAGTRWVGTGSALYRVQASGTTRLAAEAGLNPPAVVGMSETVDGKLMVGTIGGGGQIYEGGTFVRQTGAPELSNTTVRDLRETADGTRWYATQVGLIQISKDGTSRRWQEADGLPNQQVLALLPVGDGVLWIGTSRGLARIRGNRLESFAEANRMLSTILAISMDGPDALWLATQNGLARVTGSASDKPTFELLSGPGALPPRAYFSVLADNADGLWMCSSQGIIRASAAALRERRGRSAPIPYTVIGRGEGMASMQCNGSSQPSAFRLRDGTLWFTTTKGVAAIDPRAAQPRQQRAPPVVLRDVVVNGKPVAPTGAPVVLTAGRNRIEVGYAALRFVTPERVQYRYRLLGLSEWAVTDENRAVFEALPPGRYTFQVAARNADGPWGEPLDGLLVLQAAHFWQHAWVQIASLLGLPLAVFGVYRMRVAGLKRRNEQLESLVAARTTALADETQRLLEANGEKAKLLAQVGEQAASFARLAREDALTGLANRRELDARLREEYERAARHRYPLSVAIVDADHFKRVNDRHGHATGDEVLRRLGKLLRETSREIDFVARFGGEEFVLVLPHTSINQAQAICERVRKAIADHAWTELVAGLRVTVSIGVAESRADQEAGEAGHERLLSRADAKLYLAKEEGRNRVVV